MVVIDGVSISVALVLEDLKSESLEGLAVLDVRRVFCDSLTMLEDVCTL